MTIIIVCVTACIQIVHFNQVQSVMCDISFMISNNDLQFLNEIVY